MLGVGISDGDILVIDRSVTPQAGDPVIAVWDGNQPTCKVLKTFEHHLELHSANLEFPPIVLDQGTEVEVFAVVGVVRQIQGGSDTFRPELPQHNASRTVVLPAATADITLVLGMVRRLLRGLLQEGIGYKKAGVALLDLARPEDVQQDLFAPAVAGDPKLMATLDEINRKFGRGVAGLGSSGWKEKPAWGMRQRMLSPNFTTSVHELPRVRC